MCNNYHRLYNVVSDHNGNVCQLVRQDTSAVVAIYRYDAYGLHQTEARADSDTLDAAQVSQPWRYQSKWHHSQSGLVDFGYRFYAPGLGNWMSRDPLGEAGGLNLYGYVGNDPVNMMDADGLVPVQLTWVRMKWAGGQQYVSSFAGGVRDDIWRGGYIVGDALNPLGDPYADAGAYCLSDPDVGVSRALTFTGVGAAAGAGGLFLATGGPIIGGGGFYSLSAGSAARAGTANLLRTAIANPAVTGGVGNASYSFGIELTNLAKGDKGDIRAVGRSFVFGAAGGAIGLPYIKADPLIGYGAGTLGAVGAGAADRYYTAVTEGR